MKANHEGQSVGPIMSNERSARLLEVGEGAERGVGERRGQRACGAAEGGLQLGRQLAREKPRVGACILQRLSTRREGEGWRSRVGWGSDAG